MSVNVSLKDVSCIKEGQVFFIYSSYCVTTILVILPLCIFVIYQWWVKRSSSSSSSCSTDLDCFTYHLVAMETVGRVGMVFNWFISFLWEEKGDLLLLGSCLIFFAWYGEMLFHVLTCVERYLAAVRPVAYLSLRGERGVRLRNGAAGCVWLLCLGGLSFLYSKSVNLVFNFFVYVVSLSVVSFCSVSVLRVLIRPGPGQRCGGGAKKRMDQSKKRAFFTIVAILGALLVKLIGSVIYSMGFFTGSDLCVILVSAWCGVPSRMVLPLLYLNKAAARRRAKEPLK